MTSARKMLTKFYDQALFTPDLLCLNCAYTAWRGPRRCCSPARKEDCLFFVNDILNWLDTEPNNKHRKSNASSLA